MSTRFEARKAWGIAAMLAALQLVNFVDKVVVGLVAVPMMEELQLTPVQFGMVAGSVFWLFSVGGVAGGFLANRFPTRWLLLGMAAAWSLVQLPIATSSSLAVIVAARVLLGLTEGPSAPVASHSMFKWFPDSKRSLPTALINVGATCGVLVAGLFIPVVSRHWGWRANFWVLAAIGVLWAMLWLAFGREGRIGTSADSPDEATAGLRERVPYRRLLADTTFLGACFMHFCAFWTTALGLTWLPAYLDKGLGFSGQHGGQMFALIIALSVPVMFLVSWLSQHLRERGAGSRRSRVWVGCAALAASGIAFALPWITPGLGPLAKGLALSVGLGLSTAVYSMAPPLIGEIAPLRQRGALLAIEVAVFGSIAGVLAPVLLGWAVQGNGVAAVHGYELGFAISGALSLVGGLLVLGMAHPERSRRNLHGSAAARQQPPQQPAASRAPDRQAAPRAT